MSIAVRDMYSITSEDVDFVVQFVAKESGIVLDHAKTYLIDSRLADVARRLNLGGPSEVIKKLRTMPTPDLQRQAVEAMTTNETSFFRDHSPFEALKTDIVPKLITQNAAKRSIRIWSAACSTGQEAYSIAMTLRESFPVLSTWKIEIVGTDINSQVLQRARDGKFSQLEVNRGLPAPLLIKYFTQSDRDWVIKPDLIRMTDFRSFNLLKDLTVLGRFDIIFCRNVLIYFDVPTKRRMLTEIQRMMDGTGVLFLGGAETVYGVVDGYKRLTSGKAVYYQVG